MNVFDQAARFAVKLDPMGFLAWLLPGLARSLTFTGWLDTQTIPFPGEPDRRCDTVAELVHAEGVSPPWVLVVELESHPDPDMAYRLLEYLGRLGRELRHGPHGRDRYLLAAAVVNLTGTAETGTLEMVLPDSTGVELRLKARTCNLRQRSAAEVLAGIPGGMVARCLLPWIPLMDGGDQEENLTEWKKSASQETDRRRRGELGGLALLFADLAGSRPGWTALLEDWNVEESVVVASWIAKGEERGLKRGRDEGMKETRKKDLSRVLEVRFGGPLPADLVASIQSQDDVNQLGEWLDVAVTCPSLAEFQQHVQADDAS